mmetsp:Transcript_23125/g.33839  ORF Transcript_23125/g.33839 Transcript_23125/m.33839 type:complete len:189 (-) Transcript_23125:237-803(-)
MKLQIAALMSLMGTSMAFTSTPSFATQSSSTSLEATRRESLSSIFTTSAATLATLTTLSTPAFAAREPRPEYLTEPTEAFKESERQRDEFRRNQLLLKKKFTSLLDRLTFESTTEAELVTDLDQLRALVIETGGLPLGIKKDEMVKIIRAKKAKGFWPTNVEISYQGLTREIAYQQSPNREKDTANPL